MHPAVSLPAVCVILVERADGFGDDAEQQSGGVPHHLPGVHLLYPFGAEPLQPGHFGRQIVGVDVEMYPARPILEPLDEQPELLPVQRSTVVLRVPVELGQWPPGGCAPERQLAVVVRWRDVNHDLGQPAVVRHAANLRDLRTDDQAATTVPALNPLDNQRTRRGTSAG